MGTAVCAEFPLFRNRRFVENCLELVIGRHIDQIIRKSSTSLSFAIASVLNCENIHTVSPHVSSVKNVLHDRELLRRILQVLRTVRLCSSTQFVPVTFVKKLRKCRKYCQISEFHPSLPQKVPYDKGKNFIFRSKSISAKR